MEIFNQMDDNITLVLVASAMVLGFCMWVK